MALTDVTGFAARSPAEHRRREQSRARGSTLNMPVLPAAREYLNAGIAPGGTHANRRFLADWVTYDADVTEQEQLLLCDAQTSGGLLAAVAPDEADATLEAWRKACRRPAWGSSNRSPPPESR
ncbi:MAG: hypothetical protein U0992_13725 [Planctomycetaceae bacterium]